MSNTVKGDVSPSHQKKISIIISFIIGIFFLISATTKATDMNGTFLSVLTYDIPGMTLGMAHVISYVLVALEYLIAIWVISRWKHDAAMKTVIVMMVMFICLIAVTWARGLSIDCGCFGHTENVDNPIKGYIEVMIRDAVVALLCLYNMTTLTYVNSAR